MRRFSPVFLSIAILFVSACGPSKPDIDEKKILSRNNFSQPIELSAQLDRLFDSEGKAVSSNSAVIAFLAKAGYVQVMPNMGRAPWWNFNVTGGSLNNEYYRRPIANRLIVDRTNEKQWSKDSVDFYAVTLVYKLDIDSQAATIIPDEEKSKKYEYRLVLKNDPAVGHWDLAEPEQDPLYPDVDMIVDISDAKTPKARENITALLSSITKAQRDAYDGIEKSLASSGTIERSNKNPDILISRKYNLSIFVSARGIMQNNVVSLSGAAAYCDRISSVTPLRGWRLPKMQEIGELLVAGRLPDVPDGRLWRDIGKPYPLGGAFYLTDNMHEGDNGARYTIEDLPDMPQYHGIGQVMALETWVQNWDASMVTSTVTTSSFDAFRYPLTKERILGTVLQGGNPQTRIICVTSL